MHAGNPSELANRTFEIGPGLFVVVEQHRNISKRVYQMGDRATICRPAEDGVLLES